MVLWDYIKRKKTIKLLNELREELHTFYNYPDKILWKKLENIQNKILMVIDEVYHYPKIQERRFFKNLNTLTYTNREQEQKQYWDLILDYMSAIDTIKEKINTFGLDKSIFKVSWENICALVNIVLSFLMFWKK